MLTFTQFCKFKELQEKSVLLQIAAQAFGDGDFLIKHFPIKKMCVIACLLLYLYSEGTQLFKRNYFIITSWMVKRKARKCHQKKLQELLEV